MVTKEHIESILKENIKVFFNSNGLLITVSGKRLFLKSGCSSRAFLCESHGLSEIAKTNTVKTPQVIAAEDTFILTEYIENTTPDPIFSVSSAFS